ncbi:MAG: polysaccharide deacetylase family protein [Bacilli bacterium]|nr:polysaccharide deacetylase family protein [Bacilli bacterium]
MKKKRNIKMILIFSGIFCIFLTLLIFKINLNNKQKDVWDSKLADETLTNILTQEANYVLVEHKMISSQFTQAILKNDNGTYKSYFINVKDGNLLNIEDIIKSEEQQNFKNKVQELIELKYPKFIADSLNYGNGNITYILKDTELIMYFYDFEINPKPLEELFLMIDYNEIKDYVNFPFHLKEEYERENGFTFDPAKKTVALTFDDGPNGSKTLRLVELLHQNKMHATFFMVGNRMATAPNVIKEVLKTGNEVGSHSYNHKNLTRLTKEELLEEEKSTNLIYKSITGQDLKLLRPPYGNVNDTMKQNLNLTFINWNLDTEDWRYRNTNHIYDSVINKVKDGDIILMHDLYETTIEAVEKLLPELYVRGFQVVSVSELANIKGQTLEVHKVYRSF